MSQLPRFLLAASLAAFVAAPLKAEEPAAAPKTEEAAPLAEGEEAATSEAVEEAAAEEAEEAAEEAASEATEETRELAARYLSLPAIQKMNDDLYGGNVIDSMMAMQDSLPEEIRKQLATILSEEFAKIRPGMEEAMIESAAATYSAEELQAMIAFYESPEGASMAVKTAPFTQKTFEIFGPQMEEFQKAVVTRLMAEMPQ
ncbi:DUF2059 domain-containing protein [Neomegalonema perideroedes]|uniref:DUF2059 domain-containing protein n=1 Tax=Neomegalonema perideroedes TaxID=217219 RepID=UPI000376A017|nr:DUF2059 domain-containing protein [Neomegalonema perideroedes]